MLFFSPGDHSQPGDVPWDVCDICWIGQRMHPGYSECWLKGKNKLSYTKSLDRLKVNLYEVTFKVSGPVLLRVDNAIQRINHYPEDNCLENVLHYAPDSNAIHWIALSTLWTTADWVFVFIFIRFLTFCQVWQMLFKLFIHSWNTAKTCWWKCLKRWPKAELHSAAISWDKDAFFKSLTGLN